MIEVVKIEDFVISQLFRPYMSYFINEEFQSVKYCKIQNTFEKQLRKRPELIIYWLNDMPEAKSKVINRLKKFGGVKWYRYLDMNNPVIRWVNENLEECNEVSNI